MRHCSDLPEAIRTETSPLFLGEQKEYVCYLSLFGLFPAMAFLSLFLRPTIVDRENSFVKTLSGLGLLPVCVCVGGGATTLQEL